MAFKLTNHEDTELARHVDGLNHLASALEDAIRDYNDALARGRVFAESVLERLQGEFDDKSEQWQGTDRGGEAASLIEQWETAIELEDLEVPDLPHVVIEELRRPTP